MICVAISDRNLETCLSVLDAVQMAEIRLDLTDFTADEIRTVFSHKTITIATCRPDKKGAEYVDKNLKYHGLIQAYSRTNRILNEKKSQGNIVCFRNLKKNTDDAIALFSNKDAIITTSSSLAKSCKI